jgi:hypothetical protein
VKPIFSIPYEEIDWWDPTDAKFIEFCISSFDPEHFSLRVHRRREDGGYSRMSEQLPLARSVDLTVLLIYSLKAIKERKYHITIPQGSFGYRTNGEPSPEITISVPPILMKEVIADYAKNSASKYIQFLKKKLIALADVLKDEIENL